MGNHACVCFGCLWNAVSTWMLLFWSMEPNVCRPNNRTEVQMPYLRSAQSPKPVGHTDPVVSRCGAGPPVYKLLLSETVSVTLFGWRRTRTSTSASMCAHIHLSRSVSGIRFCQPVGRGRVPGIVRLEVAQCSRKLAWA